MARIAGMRLRQRYSDWSRAPFTADSRSHISVWEKPSDETPQCAGRAGGGGAT
jgi:hypothetical protein